MNNSVTKENILRRLRTGDPQRLESSPALTALLNQHGLEVWSVLATQGNPRNLEWAWQEGARFSEADGQTWLVQTLLQQRGDALIDTASWWRDHGAPLPPAPPAAPDPVLERQLTTDSLWRRVIDTNPEAITWLAAQGLAVQFDRPEAGGLLSHAVHSHKLKAGPVIDRLIEAGAEGHIQDAQGENVCHALARLHVDPAQEAPYLALWSRVIEAGASPEVTNLAQESALDLLSEEQAAAVVALSRAQSATVDPDATLPSRRVRNRRS